MGGIWTLLQSAALNYLQQPTEKKLKPAAGWEDNSA